MFLTSLLVEYLIQLSNFIRNNLIRLIQDVKVEEKYASESGDF